MKRNKAGFTLIEIMVAIAIVSILAGVVLVSMSAYAKKARASKALAQLSSAIPGMVSCWGNSGTVNALASGASICSIGASYGNWPAISGDLSTYSYGTVDGTDYCVASSCTTFTKSNWWFRLDSSSSNDNKRICCNSTMNSCKEGVSLSDCNATIPSN